MLSQLLHELSRAPMLALWFVINLVAAVVLLVALSDDIRTSTMLRRVVLIIALSVIAAAVGLIIAGGFAIVYAIEARAFHRLLEAKTPARRIH